MTTSRCQLEVPINKFLRIVYLYYQLVDENYVQVAFCHSLGFHGFVGVISNNKINFRLWSWSNHLFISDVIASNNYVVVVVCRNYALTF
jgi:hypothetical protein